MATNPMDGYVPLEYFQETDHDHSAQRIRDMPYGKRRESLVIYPTEIAFPGIPIGTVSPPYPIMVTNDGYDIVVINEIKIVGDFLLYGNITSLIPGQHASLSAAYIPKREGPTTGGIYINSGNAAGAEFILLSSIGSSSGGGYSYHLYYLATTGQTVFPFSTPDRFGKWFTGGAADSLTVHRNGSRLMPTDGTGAGAYTMLPDNTGITLAWPAGDNESIIIDI